MKRKFFKVKGEERKRIRKMLRHPDKVKRFEMHTAMAGVYEIRARLANGTSVCLGSEASATGVTVNGGSKADLVRRMIRCCNQHLIKH